MVSNYIDIFKKFTLNTLGVQESYKLDHIASVVLGEKKLDYSEHGTLHGLYKNDFQKFIDFLWGICEFLCQNFEEFNNFWIVIVNTKIEAVEESHWILFDVRIMLTNN